MNYLDVDSALNSEKLTYTDFENSIIKLSEYSDNSSFDKINFDFDINSVKFSDKNETENKYWKSGVGYGHSGKRKWDINEYINKEKEKKSKISNAFENNFRIN